MTAKRRKSGPFLIDKTGHKLRLSSTASLVLASDNDIVIASLYLVHEADGYWRVQGAWVEDGYRRRGIATGLYDHAFRTGFKPLRRGRIQTAGGAALWDAHIQTKLATKGDFVTHDHPDRFHWWPAAMPVKRKQRLTKT